MHKAGFFVLMKILIFILFTAGSCSEDPPVFDTVNKPTTLEGPYITGFQANYSCDIGCVLTGSESLRCVPPNWQLENETLGNPTCLCLSKGHVCK